MIQSNLKAVIARLEQYQAGLPGCVDRALARGFWEQWLAARAAAALAHQFSLIEDVQTRERYVKRLPALLDQLGVVVRPGLATFTFGILPETVSEVNFAAAAKYAELSWTPSGRARKNALPDPLAANNLAAARQAILDWVTLEKERDERDAGKSNEEIAEHIEKVLGLQPSMSYQNEAMREAAQGLRGAIEAWLAGDPVTPTGDHDVKTAAPDATRNMPNRTGAVGGVSSAQVRTWLAAVLQTWLANFQTVLRDRIRAELVKLHQQVQAKQPGLL